MSLNFNLKLKELKSWKNNIKWLINQILKQENQTYLKKYENKGTKL